MNTQPIKVVFDASTRVTWLVRLVLEGQSYGRGLVHDKAEPMVEFFDTRYPMTDLGQFVSRYYLSTFLQACEDPGVFCLDTGSPDWSLSAKALTDVYAWLKSQGPAARFLAAKPCFVQECTSRLCRPARTPRISAESSAAPAA